ncbi:MAG: hypothetical protein VX438_00465 [Planctomycetota bacterium]|jgi:hypothetical protein|nr:hypothetical protein [Planctomycetota bacterium]
MRLSILGVVTLGILFLALSSFAFQEKLPQKPILDDQFNHNQKWKENSTVTAENDGLIAIRLEGNATSSQIALVDPKRKVLSVYGIDRNSGEIKLSSVRKVEWDLRLDEFNGKQPTPREIRSNVERR